MTEHSAALIGVELRLSIQVEVEVVHLIETKQDLILNQSRPVNPITGDSPPPPVISRELNDRF